MVVRVKGRLLTEGIHPRIHADDQHQSNVRCSAMVPVGQQRTKALFAADRRFPSVCIATGGAGTLFLCHRQESFKSVASPVIVVLGIPLMLVGALALIIACLVLSHLQVTQLLMAFP